MKDTAVSSHAAFLLTHFINLCHGQCSSCNSLNVCVCVSVSCQSPLFLAASCSDPGVCSTSFLHCHNLGQASSMSSNFMKSTAYDCVCWRVSLHTSMHGHKQVLAMVHAENGTQGFSAAFWCDLRSVRTNIAWHLWSQRQIRKDLK